MKTETLIIPVYLNQKIVFDLLAMRENGFARMYTVKRNDSSTETDSSGVDGQIGFSNVFSFLGVKIGANLKADSKSSSDESISEERIHTPASLFSKLLTYLTEDGIIKEIANKESLNEIKCGDFISFKGKIKQNPLVKTFDSMINLMNLMTAMTPKAKGQKNSSDIDLKSVMNQIVGLTNSLKLGDMIDLVGTINDDCKAVIQSEINFFDNRNIGIIEEGNYSVLGKVIKIAADNETKISLLRNSGLSMANSIILSQLIQALQNPEMATSGISIPELTYEIENGILIIPIAIYA